MVLTSHSAHAYPDLSLGGGYTRDCETAATVESDGTYKHTCRSGPRAELSLDLFGGEGSKAVADPPEIKTKKKSTSGGGSWGGNWGGAAGFQVVAIIVVAILIAYVTYGLIMAIIAMLSWQRSYGFYYAEDYFPDSDTSIDGTPLPTSVRRWGVKASFFPFESVALKLHMGAGPASFVARTDGDARTYRDGFSSKIGIGFAPRPGENGIYVSAETEYLTAYARTFKELKENNQPKNKPEYRATTSGLVGFTFAL